MNSLNLFLEFLTLIALISALATITSTNPIIAIVFLIVLFLNVGIYLILMGLQFIGLSYLLVYVGAITVLFLFIVMMLNIEVSSSVEVGTNYSKLLPLMFSVAILFVIIFYMVIPSFDIELDSGLREIYVYINNFIYGTNPLYFDSNFGVHNFYELYFNNITGGLIMDNSTFGDPATLLHKNIQIQTLGEAIYGNYSILLILSSFLLLLAMVCPIVLARNSNTSTT